MSMPPVLQSQAPRPSRSSSLARLSIVVLLHFAAGCSGTSIVHPQSAVRISRLNDALRMANMSWIAGDNPRFSGADYAAILLRARLLMGAKVPPGLSPPKPGLHKPRDPAASNNANATVPETWDSIIQFPHCSSLADIWDQGACGSCYVLATVQSAADRVCVATHGKNPVRFSGEDMLACCRSCGNGCAGGFPPYAWAFMASHGVVRL